MTDAPNFSDFSSAEQWLEDYRLRAEETMRRAKEFQGRLRELEGVCSTEYVRVVVDPNGVLISAELTERGERRTAREAVQLTVEACQRATADAAHKAIMLTEEYSGSESETVQQMRTTLRPEIAAELQRIEQEKER